VLDTLVLLCVCLYTKNQTAIKVIVESYIQDAYKLNEAQTNALSILVPCITEYRYIILMD
jgi:hypothetical protein